LSSARPQQLMTGRQQVCQLIGDDFRRQVQVKRTGSSNKDGDYKGEQ